MENNSHNAGQAYRKALATPPPGLAAYARKAAQLIIAGNFTKAMEYMLKMEKLYPEYPYLYLNMGTVYANTKQFDKALEAYQKALKIHGESTDVLCNMGMIYLEMPDVNSSEALKCFQRAVELNPKQDKGFFGIGQVYYKTEDYEKSIENQLKTYALNPGFPGIEYHIGLAYISNEQYEEALSYFQKAHKKKPLKVDVLRCIGLAHNGLKQYDKALMYLQQAVDLQPDNWATYYDKGMVYLAMRQSKQALACFKHAFELNSTEGIILWEMAECYQQLNKPFDFYLYACKATALGCENAKAESDNVEVIATLYRQQSPITREEFKKSLKESPLLHNMADGKVEALLELVINADKYDVTIGAYDANNIPSED